VLPLDESVALLGKITGVADNEGAHLLADELGGLPVALSQAGAFIAKTGWDYGRYIEMLRTRPLRLHSQDLAGVGTTMVQVWESSLEQVTRSGRYGALAPEVLGVMSYFAAEDIPRYLLTTPTIHRETVLGSGDALDVELALIGLSEYSLISLEPDAIGVHRLVQHLTRLRLDHHGMAVNHVGAAIRSLHAVLEQPGPTSERVNRLLPHLTEATMHAVRLSAAPHEVTTLLNAAAFDRLELGQLDVARFLLDRALPLATDVLGPAHSTTLAMRHNRACWVGEAGGARDAVDQLQVLLVDHLRVLGPDHAQTLSTRGNLARWLGEAGRVQEAVDQLHVLLTDCLRVLGADNPGTLATRSHLATYLGEAGRVGEAVEQLQALLADCLRVLGADNPGTLRTRGNLAHWLGEAGRVEEAAAQFEALLHDRLRILGPDHRDTLAVRHNLVHWLGEAGRTKEVLDQLHTLRADCLRVLGPDHPETLRTRGTLARWLGRAGRVQEAVDRLRALLVDDLRVLGPDHPTTLTARNNLAHWLGEAGRGQEAAVQFQALLTDRLRVLGPDHPDTLTTRSNLVYWLGKQKVLG
jgi:tetratricopeptide (TPR) repeat protein